jgi:hypothetical protein
MVYNYINKLCMSLLVAMVLTSCSDFTDTTPKGKVIPSTTDDFKGMVIDPSNASTAYPLANVCSDDVFSNDLEATTTQGKAYYWMENFFLSNENDYCWNDTYSRIYVMNTVIDNLPSSSGGTENEKAELMAEAKYWRAYLYWLLQSLYAKDYNAQTASSDLSVPLSLHGDLEASLPRATVSEVTAQILSDLEGSETLLPSKPSNDYRPSKGAAYALKARILFYQHEYDKAAEQAKLALQENSTMYDMRTWSFKNEKRPSAGINGREAQGQFSPEKLGYLSSNMPSILTSMCISDDLQALFESGDLRFKFYFSNLDRMGKTWEDGKYRFIQNLDYNLGVPEMMLIEAEALARKNDASCLDILNKLRQNRFSADSYHPLTANSGTSLLDLVLDERRREMCLSSLRWLDMKRLAAEGIYTKTLTRTLDGTVYTLVPNSKLYVFPIPLQVLSLNSNIVPNDRKQ